MASSNAQRFLNKGGDNLALGLKMFWGTVLEAFRETTQFYNSQYQDNSAANIIAQKDITSTGGKSWQFPLMGPDPDTEDHTPGVEMLGLTIEIDEGTITIDDFLVSHVDVPKFDLAVAHFDVIAPFARKLGRAIANKLDERALYMLIQAARTAALTKNSVTIHNGGNVVSRVNGTSLEAAYPVSTAGAANFHDDVAELAQLMDDDQVPEEQRYLFISPYMKRVMGKDTDLFDRDYSTDGNDRNSREIGIMQGFRVFQTTKLPSTNVTTGLSKYQADYSHAGSVGQPAAVAACGAAEGEGAVGVVTAGGITPHMEVDERRNTVFMKAEALAGFGSLSVWCAGEIRVPNS